MSDAAHVPTLKAISKALAAGADASNHSSVQAQVAAIDTAIEEAARLSAPDEQAAAPSPVPQEGLLPCMCGRQISPYLMGTGASDCAWYRADCACGVEFSGPIADWSPQTDTASTKEAFNKFAAAWNRRTAAAPSGEGWVPYASKVLTHKWLDPQCIEGGCRSLLLGNALRAYRTAQRRMLEKWSEGDKNVKLALWQGLHACEADANAALDQDNPPAAPHPPASKGGDATSPQTTNGLAQKEAAFSAAPAETPSAGAPPAPVNDLVKYTRHLNECAIVRCQDPGEACSCGLAALIERLSAPPQESVKKAISVADDLRREAEQMEANEKYNMELADKAHEKDNYITYKALRDKAWHDQYDAKKNRERASAIDAMAASIGRLEARLKAAEEALGGVQHVIDHGRYYKSERGEKFVAAESLEKYLTARKEG